MFALLAPMCFMQTCSQQNSSHTFLNFHVLPQLRKYVKVQEGVRAPLLAACFNTRVISINGAFRKMTPSRGSKEGTHPFVTVGAGRKQDV